MMGMGFGGGIGARQLVQNDEIKSRLGLTEQQVEQLQKIADEMRPRDGRGTRQQGDRNQGERPPRPSQAQMEQMRAEMEKRMTEAREKINTVLTPEQREKYKELSFQMAGGLDSPFLNSRMLDVVQLTEEQKAKIKAIEDEREKEGRAAMEQFRGIDWRNPSEEDRSRMQKLREEGEKRAKKYSELIQVVLTPEQKDKARALTEEGKGLRPQRGGPRGGGPDRGGDYRPGNDSWQPGQGARNQDGQNRNRRAFPTSERQEQPAPTE